MLTRIAVTEALKQTLLHALILGQDYVRTRRVLRERNTPLHTLMIDRTLDEVVWEGSRAPWITVTNEERYDQDLIQLITFLPAYATLVPAALEDADAESFRVNEGSLHAMVRAVQDLGMRFNLMNENDVRKADFALPAKAINIAQQLSAMMQSDEFVPGSILVYQALADLIPAVTPQTVQRYSDAPVTGSRTRNSVSERDLTAILKVALMRDPSKAISILQEGQAMYAKYKQTSSQDFAMAMGAAAAFRSLVMVGLCPTIATSIAIIRRKWKIISALAQTKSITKFLGLTSADREALDILMNTYSEPVALTPFLDVFYPMVTWDGDTVTDGAVHDYIMQDAGQRPSVETFFRLPLVRAVTSPDVAPSIVQLMSLLATSEPSVINFTQTPTFTLDPLNVMLPAERFLEDRDMLYRYMYGLPDYRHAFERGRNLIATADMRNRDYIPLTDHQIIFPKGSFRGNVDSETTYNVLPVIIPRVYDWLKRNMNEIDFDLIHYLDATRTLQLEEGEVLYQRPAAARSFSGYQASTSVLGSQRQKHFVLVSPEPDHIRVRTNFDDRLGFMPTPGMAFGDTLFAPQTVNTLSGPTRPRYAQLFSSAGHAVRYMSGALAYIIGAPDSRTVFVYLPDPAMGQIDVNTREYPIYALSDSERQNSLL